MASYARSWPSLWTGRLAQAANDAQRAVDVWSTGSQTYLPAASYYLVTALVELGRLDDARAALEAIDGERWRDTAFYAFVLAAQARVSASAGDFAAGRRAWEDSGDHIVGRMHARNPVLLPWRSEAAMLSARLEDPRARSLAAEDLRAAERFGAPRPLGLALRAAGLASRGTEGIALLARAASTFADCGARLEHAHALVDLGGALRRAGRPAQGRERLRAGLAIARDCGAAPLVSRATAELKAAGGRPERDDDVGSGASALTPSERRVAELAADGRRNRDIATELFVTIKAVEWHLSRVYAKLEIDGRAALPSVLGVPRRREEVRAPQPR